MDESVVSYLKIVNAPTSNAPGLLKNIQRLPHILSIGWNMLRLYVMKPIDTDHLEGSVR
jgi:magnesium-protoporphyrin IX monomethyl ester (oxidative) cyclase